MHGSLHKESEPPRPADGEGSSIARASKKVETLSGLISLIEETFPLPRRFLVKLPSGIAELSRLLTSARGERGLSYLNRPELLHAYLRYFLPWNVFRFLKLCEFPPAAPFGLEAGDAVTDLGSGPLTLPIALWLAFPALRSVPLEFRCVDRCGAALEAGKTLFRALAAPLSGDWRIKTIRGPIEAPVRGKKAKLVSVLNALNENARPGGAERAAALLCGLCAEDGAVFVMEPGVPESGAFIAALRAALQEWGKFPAAPCVHAGPCPLPGPERRGRKAKWCHFAAGTDAAPAALRKLSEAAGLPKDRAVFSYLLAAASGPAGAFPAKSGGGIITRALSDAFAVTPSGAGPVYGRYGCYEKGLALLTGSKREMESLEAGRLAVCLSEGGRDAKSGALLLKLCGIL